MKNNIYSKSNIYDIFFNEDPFIQIINKYKKLISKYGEPVLELACGTGRITSPLASSGVDITGLDLSENMIDLAKRKNKNIDFIVSDMRHYELNKKFNFIFIPNQSFQHLYTLDDVSDFFNSVKKHLHKQGTILIQVFNPSFPILVNNDKRQPTSKEYYIDKTTNKKYYATIKSSYNNATQVLISTYYYEKENEKIENTFDLTMRQFFPQELDSLAVLNGFKILDKFGKDMKTKFNKMPNYQNLLLGI